MGPQTIMERIASAIASFGWWLYIRFAWGGKEARWRAAIKEDLRFELGEGE